MQTWLRRGSNCRVRLSSPGKFFRRKPAASVKANKIKHFSLARRLHCFWLSDQKGSG